MKKRAWLLLILALVLGAGWWLRAGLPGLAGDTAQASRDKPLPLAVELAAVRQRPMPVELRAVGQVEPAQTVAIRAQVSGVLQKVAFTEGARVEAGQLLFVIDPRPFEAAVAQAEAALARDRAALANAQVQYKRLAPLAKQDFVTASELSDAQTAAEQAAAAVAADKAQLKAAKIQLGYTRIKSPIRGRTGAVSLNVGNVADANAATPLVVINQISPIDVRFTVPQAALARVRKFQREGTIQVAVSPGDEGQTPVPARLSFIDNTVDQTTGTITLKARADNNAYRLWPGQFVSVALILTVQQDALVVPTVAVQPGQKGPYVFRVENGVAHVHPVTVARQQDGYTVISDGLAAGDQVVLQVPRNLTDGSLVQALPSSSIKPAATSVQEEGRQHGQAGEG